jgi:nicotinamide-nucleotide amidase
MPPLDGPVEILTIGAELLLGETADTNAPAISRALRENGFTLCRTVTVGDDAQAICEAVREACARSRAVVVTGGLGPTVDDPTREAVALAAGVALEFHEELWAVIQERFKRSGRAAAENNRRQAYLPRGAAAIPNPVGTAPGFSMEIGGALLIAMPGVPAEMMRMLADHTLPHLRNRMGGPAGFRLRTLHAGGLGESQIDERIGEWERAANPTVGLTAHNGLVDVRIVARGSEAGELLAQAEADIRHRLQGYIFSADDEFLADAVWKHMPIGMRLASIEFGTRGYLAGQLSGGMPAAFAGGCILADGDHFLEDAAVWRRERSAEYLAAVRLVRGENGFESEILWETPDGRNVETRRYALEESGAVEWTVHQMLFRIWQSLSQDPPPSRSGSAPENNEL